ncbi:MAG TPA: bifunctional serine/threonine-protein kinase/formylglycine-generating enzyme family protein [Gemmataceae bacterium]|jgi:serine/threonine protein kinase/formylglycine-generating enzyme required for sulfatase activity|nr:bifunctional serine/threonine-protein kinase/formylglycine-generating enzyme family protein [Gemmataceae bacterium]
MTSPSTTPCPTDERLKDYLRGRVSHGELEEVAGHVRECRTCVGKLDALDRTNPPIIRSGSSAAAAAASPSDPALEQAIRRLLSPVGFPTGQQADPLMPGDRLGDYRLIEQIGEGGMGTTYKARHTRLEKVVALKVLRPQLAQDPAAVARFRREMRAIGRLQDPHIVQATDAGEARGFLYLVMEFLDGVTLSQHVRRQGPLAATEACRVIRDAARGLRHAHQQGLVHRDVKPSNVMLGPDGQVKLLDLGLALLRQPSTEGSTAEDNSRLSDDRGVIGTNDYMAPEQWKCSSQVDARADQYSLGCALFYVLVGRPPFARDSEDTQYDKMQSHLHLPPPKPSLIRPGIPAELDIVVARMLAKNPTERFASMDEVIDALSPFAGDPVKPAPASSVRRRRPVWMAIAAVLMFGVGLAAFWKPLFGKHETAPPIAEPPPTQPPTPVAKVQPGPGLLPMKSDEARDLQARWADYLGRPVVEKTTAGVEMVLIPPGEFSPDRISRLVFPRPFDLSQTEVTIAQFRQFVLETNYQTFAEKDGRGQVWSKEKKDFIYQSGLSWKTPGTHQPTDEHPVVMITWDDANKYCDWLTGREKRTCRLPTEWEWQWACRAGSDQRHFYGSDSSVMDDYAWHATNAGDAPRPVAGKRPNTWGLFDMHGNAGEWCLNLQTTLAGERYVDYRGATMGGKFRAACGGSYDTLAPTCPHRLILLPSLRWSRIGFRVLREAPPELTDGD